ncbi:MAG: hypothetical protein IT459_22735 [Planctomycetes bacterium]|nr:hypothetical protein [Planctomycetota bacterium]
MDLFEESTGASVLRGPGDSLIGLANDIVRAPTRDLRTALLETIAPGYRELVGKLAADMLGTDIALLRGSEARRAAVEQVPVELVDSVCGRVVMLMQAAKELRGIDARRAPGAVLL